MKNLNNNMTICILMIALIFAGTVKSGAQKKAEFGFRFMPTISSFHMNASSGGTVKGEAALGFGVGVMLGYSINKQVGIQAEVIYNSISQKYKEQDVERRINLQYINIPFFVSLNTDKSQRFNANIVAGPQVGISVGSRIITSGNDATTPPAVVAIRNGDLGLAYGAGLHFGMNKINTIRFDLGFRGVLGLVDISDDSKSTANGSYLVLDKTNIKTYSIFAGLSFLF